MASLTDRLFEIRILVDSERVSDALALGLDESAPVRIKSALEATGKFSLTS